MTQAGALSHWMTPLRSSLTNPELRFQDRDEWDTPEYFRGRAWGRYLARGADPEVLPELADPRFEQTPEWTAEGLTALLERLDDERPVQAKVIRAAAAQPGGYVPRALVYELGRYEESRTLRGFTKPVERITRQLQSEGLAPPGVAPALATIYDYGVRATHFAVPPDIRRLLANQPAHQQVNTTDLGQRTAQEITAILAQIPDRRYREAVEHILVTAAAVDGLKIVGGQGEYTLRVIGPWQGKLSIGWIAPSRTTMNWQGLAGLTLGHDGASGLRLSETEHQALRKYVGALADFGGQYCPDSAGIRGWTFPPEAVIEHSTALATAIRTVMSRLRAA